MTISRAIPCSRRLQTLSSYCHSDIDDKSLPSPSEIDISTAFDACHNSYFEQISLQSSCSHKVLIVCSDSIAKKVRLLFFLLCAWISPIRPLMHLLCAAVTTSPWPKHPALWMWPMLSIGTPPWTFPSVISLIRRHTVIRIRLSPCDQSCAATSHTGTCPLPPVRVAVSVYKETHGS